jgi:hypothetical protein
VRCRAKLGSYISMRVPGAQLARRYNASAPEDTQDGEVAYARFQPSQPTRYRDGLLPD